MDTAELDPVVAEEMAIDLVSLWNEKFFGRGKRVAPSEVEEAARLIQDHGSDVILEAVPDWVRLAKRYFPACRRFGGGVEYAEDAVALVLRRRRERERDAKLAADLRKQVTPQTDPAVSWWASLSREQKGVWEAWAVARNPIVEGKMSFVRAAAWGAYQRGENPQPVPSL